MPINSEKKRDVIVKRLKEILEDSGLSQRQFGIQVLKIDNNDSFTNDIFKGRKTLSKKKAMNIVNAYPWLRIEWILGEDDYKTENEYMFKDISEIQLRGHAFITFAQLCGYQIYLSKMEDIDNILDSVKRGYTIQKDNQIIGNIPLEKFNLLSLDIQELTEQRIKSFIRETEDNNG